MTHICTPQPFIYGARKNLGTFIIHNFSFSIGRMPNSGIGLHCSVKIVKICILYGWLVVAARHSLAHIYFTKLCVNSRFSIFCWANRSTSRPMHTQVITKYRRFLCIWYRQPIMMVLFIIWDSFSIQWIIKHKAVLIKILCK